MHKCRCTLSYSHHSLMMASFVSLLFFLSAKKMGKVRKKRKLWYLRLTKGEKAKKRKQNKRKKLFFFFFFFSFLPLCFRLLSLSYAKVLMLLFFLFFFYIFYFLFKLIHQSSVIDYKIISSPLTSYHLFCSARKVLYPSALFAFITLFSRNGPT